MFVFLSIAKEGKHSNNQYIVLANLILVKMLPHNYGKPTPFLFASALLRSINIYMCVCLYMCVFVYVFFTASIFNVDESGYRLLSKYTNKYHLRLQRPLLLPLE